MILKQLKEFYPVLGVGLITIAWVTRELNIRNHPFTDEGKVLLVIGVMLIAFKLFRSMK